MVRRRLKEVLVGFDPRTFAEVPWLLSHVLFPTSLMKMILGCPESSERFLEK
jgi:hypothetical protein